MDTATNDVANWGNGTSLVPSILALALLCFGAFWATRWLSRRSMGPTGGPLRVIARQALDPKRSVFVIEAGQRCFLVGAGDSAMTLLAELDKEVVERDLVARNTRNRPLNGRFAEILARTLATGKKPAASSPVLTRNGDAEVAAPIAPASVEAAPPRAPRAQAAAREGSDGLATGLGEALSERVGETGGVT